MSCNFYTIPAPPVGLVTDSKVHNTSEKEQLMSTLSGRSFADITTLIDSGRDKLLSSLISTLCFTGSMCYAFRPLLNLTLISAQTIASPFAGRYEQSRDIDPSELYPSIIFLGSGLAIKHCPWLVSRIRVALSSSQKAGQLTFDAKKVVHILRRQEESEQTFRNWQITPSKYFFLLQTLMFLGLSFESLLSAGKDYLFGKCVELNNYRDQYNSSNNYYNSCHSMLAGFAVTLLAAGISSCNAVISNALLKGMVKNN